jgi:histone H3/H4
VIILSFEYQILELLEFKVRGATLPTLTKKLGTSEEKLSVILDSMVDEKKLVKKGRYYHLPQVAKVIHAELPLAVCHRILMKFSGLRISWDAVERLHFVLENNAKSIATEAGNNAKSRKSQTVSVGDIDAAASRLGFPITL